MTRRQIIVLIISVSIALIITHLLSELDKPKMLKVSLGSTLNISSDINEYLLPVTITPSYFSSVGKIYVALSSPHSESLKEYRIEMSVDNYSWLEIPLHTVLPDKSEINKFIELGYVNLNEVRTMIYIRSFIPPQQIKLPSDVSKKDFLNSFEGSIGIKPIKTPKDITLLILVFVSLLGTTYGILNSITPKSIMI